MKFSTHSLFWLAAAAVAFSLLFIFSKILLPFALGTAIAYLLDPVVGRLQRLGAPRGVSAFGLVALLTLLLLLTVALLLPSILEQLAQLIQNLPRYIEEARAFFQERLKPIIEPLQSQLRPDPAPPGGLPNPPPPGAAKLSSEFTAWLAQQLQSLLYGGLAFFTSLALFVLTPVVAFFLLKDWDRIIVQLDKMLPRQDAPVIRRLAGEIDWTISQYLRGQLIVILILSAFYMVALELAGLNYALIIGLSAGLLSIIPYFGAFTGLLIAGGVASYQFWPDWFSIAVVVSIFLIGQAVEGNVLTPKIVGDRVKLHPVWLIFALAAFGYLFGFTGLVIAVPLAAAIGVLVRYGLGRYYESGLYQQKSRGA